MTRSTACRGYSDRRWRRLTRWCACWPSFAKGSLAQEDRPIDLPVEVYDLLQAVIAALNAYHRADASERDHIYWDTVATARETYRARIRLGFDGATRAIPLAELDRDLQAFAAKCQAGIARAEDMNNGLPPTFFSYEPVEWEVSASGIRVKRFEPNLLPLFLEGAVRALAIQPDAAAARQLHTRVRSSALFDGKLKMYKVNASLDDQPLAIGRARAFTPGWLENESIWLHMEYKYLLALLKAGLYDEFYADFQQVLVPFQDPTVYGRSTLENSSFIVSSAHPDPALHGRGFVARLSGSTAEFLSILHLMMVGPQPFTVHDGQLGLEFRPALPGWLFDGQGVLRFTFLGAIPVITHNPARRDTLRAARRTAGPVYARDRRRSAGGRGGQPDRRAVCRRHPRRARQVDPHLFGVATQDSVITEKKPLTPQPPLHAMERGPQWVTAGTSPLRCVERGSRGEVN